MLMYLSCDKREVAGVASTPAAAPVDEPDGVGGVLGDAQGVDKHGGRRPNRTFAAIAGGVVGTGMSKVKPNVQFPFRNPKKKGKKRQ